MNEPGFSNVNNVLLIKIGLKAKEVHKMLLNNPKGSEDSLYAIDTAIIKAKEIGELVHEAKQKCTLSSDLIGCLQDIDNTEEVGLTAIGYDVQEYCDTGSINHHFGEAKSFMPDAEKQISYMLSIQPLFGEEAYPEKEYSIEEINRFIEKKTYKPNKKK